MRHQVSGRHLGRTSAHRRALRRNLAASLFEHGMITTTLEKAKFVRPFAERLVTLAKQGSLHARRRAISLLQDRAIVKEENNEIVKVGSVIKKLFEEIAPQYLDRNGGYTRIIRMPLRRIGDNGKLAMLQLVGQAQAETSSSQASKKKSKKKPQRVKPQPVEESTETPVQEVTKDTDVSANEESQDNSAVQEEAKDSPK